MSDQAELFEARRFESLSNTIFGVAMTLLASGFPKDKLGNATPDWAAFVHAYAPHLLALLLRFIVAGLFWFSHQRRLAYAAEMSRAAVLFNLLFLLSIIGLPVTSGLHGSYPDARDIVALYGFHLFLISVLNFALWWMATSSRRDWPSLGAAGAVMVIFLIGAITALFAPLAARFVWTLGFVAPVALLSRRFGPRAA